MFWRLFVSYLLFVLLLIISIGFLLMLRGEAQNPLADLVEPAVVIATLISLLSIILSYLLARRLSRPMHDLIDGANRIAEGDLGHKVHVSGGIEVSTLARTLNEMSGRLAGTFAQLDHDRQQLRTILSGMVEGVVAFDNNQKVLFANDRAGELLEFNPDHAVDRKLWEVVRQPSIQSLVEKALSSPGPYRSELEWTGPDARVLSVYLSRLPPVEWLTPRINANLSRSDTSGAVMVLSDLTELRRLEKLRQDFVANVSHELKTPLAVIQSNIEALQDGAVDDPHARGPFLERVQHETARLDELIRDLLRLARIESGEQLLEFASISLAEAINECLERHATRIDDKTLQVVEVPPSGDDKHVEVWADEGAIGHILDNLVDNAIKYTPSGGRIAIRWAATATQVNIEVEDNGIGIAERDLTRVFERFYRADKARNRDKGGTGLGLAIVKHLVLANNGQITVSSQLGVGTTFKISLPRANPIANPRIANA